MRHWRTAAALPLALSLLLTGAARPHAALAGAIEPPEVGTPQRTLLAYGYYCSDGTTSCTASGGGLHYMHIAVYRHDYTHSGLVDPTGYSMECGQFFPDGGGSSYYRHEWVAANSYTGDKPQPNLTGFVPPSMGGDSNAGNTRAVAFVSGTVVTDPKSSDSASVLGLQVANDDEHALVAGVLRLTMTGTIWGGNPNDHGFHVHPAGTMTCGTSRLFAYTGTDNSYYDTYGTTYPGYTDESAYEPFEGGAEVNQP
jgi:hypothetical protein